MSGFSFACAESENLYRSFSSLTKFNQGLFKSEKQASFLTRKVFRKQTEASAIDNSKFYNVPLKAGQYLFVVDAQMRWAEYGARSVIPLSYIFIADDHGIVAQYKLPYKGNLRDGAYPDPSRVKLLWERAADVQLPAPAVKTLEEVAASLSEFIGVCGKRTVFVGKVVSVRQFQSSNTFHYYDSGLRVQTVLDVDGSTVIYWNALADANKGDTVEFTATIKQHQIYKDVKQTVVSRASKVKVTKEAV